MNNILFIIIAAAAGFAAAWFISRLVFNRNMGLSKDESEILQQDLINTTTEIKVKEERLNMISENLQALKTENDYKDSQIMSLQKLITSKESDLKHITERLNEQKKEVDELQQKFIKEFENLANKILEEKTGKFTEQNKTNLDAILKPLQEKIKDFEKRVEETHKKDIEDRASIQERIRNLIESSNKISEEANNLTKALKGESKTQGNWGELILENILQKSGLAKDREYFVQPSFKTEDGNRFQPDVVVKFPDNRNIIIDSKVSLVAYERFVTADNQEKQERALNEHLISIKNHIKQLSEKKYQDLVDINSLDFVMLFMPIEPSFLIAIQKDPELWNYAYERGIILISPTNLIAVLKMASNFWEQDKQNKNVMEIARQSGALYDKFVGFVSDLKDIGNKLEATKKAYDGAMNKISTGNGNLIISTQKIKELGAKTKKDLPKELMEE